MKNKIFLTLFFIVFILLILNINNVSSAFTFEIDGTSYDTDELGITTLKYNLFYTFKSSSSINIYSSQNPLLCNLGSDGSYNFIKNGDRVLCYVLDKKTLEIKSSFGVSGFGNLSSAGSTVVFLYLDYDVLDSNGNTVISLLNPKIVKPYIFNKDVISTGKFDKVVVKSGDYNSYDNQKFYLYSYYYTDDGFESLLPRKELLLDGPSNSYFIGPDEEGYYVYEVPLTVTGINLIEGNKYGYKLAVMEWNEEYQKEVVSEYTDSIQFSIGVVTLEEKEQFDRDKQIALQEEANNTSKGIFDTIKEIISFLNPLSENFFVYKLIELLVEAFKFVFVPSDEFFENLFTDMNDWLSDRLGILYFPIDLVITFLEKIGEISDNNNAVISWQNFSFMGADVIRAGSYDLNSLLSNETLSNIHSIYLTFVDIILWLWLINLAKNTFVDIFGGKYDELGDYVEGAINTSIAYDNQRLANFKAKRRRERARLR